MEQGRDLRMKFSLEEEPPLSSFIKNSKKEYVQKATRKKEGTLCLTLGQKSTFYPITNNLMFDKCEFCEK